MCHFNIAMGNHRSSPFSVNKDELSIAWEKEGVLAVKATIDKIWKDMEKKCGP